ncbi:MAG: hypothetical protein AAFV43_11155 [Planctomycetota bacterium]
METISPDVAAWLATAEGLAWLDRAPASGATPAVVSRLRAELTATRVSAVLEVAEARLRGAAKFPRAAQMLLTRRGVEQSTDSWISDYKARRFDGFDSVIDLGCGVGGDLLGLSGVVKASVGIEADATLAAFAQHNLNTDAHWVAVHHRVADTRAVEGFSAWHVDPDRRPQGRRTVRLEASAPSLDTIESWRSQQPSFCAKLAPAATAPPAWAESGELEWISRDGECRQQVAWGGALATTDGCRRATRVFGGVGRPSRAPVSFAGEPALDPQAAERPDTYVFEPDASVLAADLTGALAASHGLRRLGGVAYLTGDRAIVDPLLASFWVIETMPLDRRRLADWLRRRGVGALEIKCRGVDVSPQRLRAELKPKGDAPMTLLLCPTMGAARKPLVIAAHRSEPA